MNKVIICGRLGQDPELKHTQSGQAVCNLSVATSKKWKNDKGEQFEKTEWHRVIIWGKSGENSARYLTKGREVLIEGELQTRNWEKDGVTHYITEIVANNVQYIGSAGSQQGGQPKPQNQNGYGAPSRGGNPDLARNLDEIPF